MAAAAVVVGQAELVGAAEGVVVGCWPRVRRVLSGRLPKYVASLKES